MEATNRAGEIYLGNGDVAKGMEYDVGGVIENMEHAPALALKPGEFITPGMIDIHVHGGHGKRFGSPETLAEDIDHYRRWIVQFGVTGFLCSLASLPYQTMLQALDVLQSVPEQVEDGADFYGAHLEGPYLSENKPGAIDRSIFRTPNMEEVEEILSRGGDKVRMITIAPEVPWAFAAAERFTQAGVTVAAGHTATDYETATKAFDSGFFPHSTHTYNAQSAFNHRKPGVIGAALTHPAVMGELIADLVHVHEGAIRLLVKCLGTERICLVSDAMEATGLPDGLYELSARQRIVKDGRSTLPDGTIAGSTATMDRCLRNMVEVIGIPMPAAIQMATLNPAKAIHKQDVVGTLEPGKRVNYIVWGEDLSIKSVFVNSVQVSGAA